MTGLFHACKNDLILPRIAVRDISRDDCLKKMKKRYSPNSGFTLLEVIAVLIIVAIVALVVGSKVSRVKSNLTGRAELLKSHVRYAQSMAMSTDERNWGIRFDAGNDQYWLFYCPTGQACASGANITSIPGAGPTQGQKVDLGAAGVQITGITPAGSQSTLAFNNFGAPYYGNLDQVLETQLAASFDITLNQAGNSETVRVTPTTGFVP